MPLAYPDPPLADDLVSLRAWRKGDIATVIEADHQDELHDLAQRIRAGAATGTIPLAPEEDEEGVLEGRIVWRWHRQRERAPRKAAEKKAKMRGDLGELRCEVCGFSETDVAKRFGALTGDIFECHHTKPLHLLTGTTKTRIADLTVLCPTCHRSLHRIEPVGHRFRDAITSHRGGLGSDRRNRESPRDVTLVRGRGSEGVAPLRRHRDARFRALSQS